MALTLHPCLLSSLSSRPLTLESLFVAVYSFESTVDEDFRGLPRSVDEDLASNHLLRDLLYFERSMINSPRLLRYENPIFVVFYESNRYGRLCIFDIDGAHYSVLIWDMNSGANLLRISRVGHLAPIHLPQLEHQELVSRKRLHLRSAMVRREHPSPVDPYDHRSITRRILQPTRCSVARREKHDDDEPRKRRSHISPWLAGTCTEAATSV